MVAAEEQVVAADDQVVAAVDDQGLAAGADHGDGIHGAQGARGARAAGVEKFPHTADKGGRCPLCLDSLFGEGYKKKKSNLSKVTRRCQNCNSAICEKHTFFACTACSSNFVTRATDNNPNVM